MDGDSGDLDSDLGSQSDLLLVLEKVTVLCCSPLPLFPSLHLACSAWKLEENLLRFKPREGGKVLGLRKCISAP